MTSDIIDDQDPPENPHTQTYNADDRKQVNKARKKAARARHDSDEVLTMIMSQPNGRRWINEQISFNPPLESPIAYGDPHATYYNLGAQQYGKKLLGDLLRLCPKMYLKMLEEAAFDEKQSA